MARAETDLYEPIKAHFAEKGFEVMGELRHTDLVARCGNVMVAVELKLKPSMKLLSQGLSRRRLTPLVCVAVERPEKVRRGSPFADFKAVTKELGLGLLLVSFGEAGALVQEVLAPKARGKISPPARAKLEKEWAGRSGDHNKGGSARIPLITAYRERALAVAAILSAFGPLSPKAVSGYLGGGSVAALLRQDYYKWFSRLSPGLYGLSEAGKKLGGGKYAKLFAKHKEIILLKREQPPAEPETVRTPPKVAKSKKLMGKVVLQHVNHRPG